MTAKNRVTRDTWIVFLLVDRGARAATPSFFLSKPPTFPKGNRQHTSFFSFSSTLLSHLHTKRKAKRTTNKKTKKTKKLDLNTSSYAGWCVGHRLRYIACARSGTRHFWHPCHYCRRRGSRATPARRRTPGRCGWHSGRRLLLWRGS